MLQVELRRETFKNVKLTNTDEFSKNEIENRIQQCLIFNVFFLNKLGT